MYIVPEEHVTECALIRVVVNTESIIILCLIKDDFQCVLHSFSTLMFINFTTGLLDGMQMDAIHNELHTVSVSDAFQIIFFQQLYCLLQLQSCFIK